MWTRVSLSRVKLLTANLISSLFLTPWHRVRSSRLISTWPKILAISARWPFWISPTLCATTITTGTMPLRFRLPACLLTRLLASAPKLAPFLAMLTCTNCPSTCEQAAAKVVRVAYNCTAEQKNSLFIVQITLKLPPDSSLTCKKTLFINKYSSNRKRVWNLNSSRNINIVLLNPPKLYKELKTCLKLDVYL